MAYDIYSDNTGRELTGGSGNNSVGYKEYRGSDQDDSGHSRGVRDNNFESGDRLIYGRNHTDRSYVDIYKSNYFRSLFGSYDIRSRDELKQNIYTSTYRFGVMNPYGSISTGREFLFFTKPDLNIYQYDSSTGAVNRNALNDSLASIPFWKDLFTYKKRTIDQLEDMSGVSGDRFNHLLQNQCSSNLEISALEASMIDTPVNMFGVGFSYRGSSEGSDDNPSFSLEFKDTRWLDVYTYFKAYEEYEKLKSHGLVRPKAEYAINKIVHDQFSIYKFIVDEDMETIIYYGKMYGVVPVSLPRDTFGSPTFDGGLSYNISFKAAFYEDMIPDILADFNALSRDYFSSRRYSIPIYNKVLDNIDSRPAQAAYVLVDKESPRAKNSPNGYIYKLCWKGNST
ncbi:MAG: hypothetical protein IKR19_08140 [Acholeplasmatales bacterium]|nr:hypothetical protein [Acholeplasmatales bacterium]